MHKYITLFETIETKGLQCSSFDLLFKNPLEEPPNMRGKEELHRVVSFLGCLRRFSPNTKNAVYDQLG